eukprot:3343268-Prymnesium_polylepis.1
MVAALASVEDIGRIGRVSHAFHDAPPDVVLEGLRLRAVRCGGRVPRAEEVGEGLSVAQALILAELRERAGCRSAVGASENHSAFVNSE